MFDQNSFLFVLGNFLYFGGNSLGIVGTAVERYFHQVINVSFNVFFVVEIYFLTIVKYESLGAMNISCSEGNIKSKCNIQLQVKSVTVFNCILNSKWNGIYQYYTFSIQKETKNIFRPSIERSLTQQMPKFSKALVFSHIYLSHEMKIVQDCIEYNLKISKRGFVSFKAPSEETMKILVKQILQAGFQPL